MRELSLGLVCRQIFVLVCGVWNLGQHGDVNFAVRIDASLMVLSVLAGHIRERNDQLLSILVDSVARRLRL